MVKQSQAHYVSQRTDLSLRIALDSQFTKVKLYRLHPDVRMIVGYGVNNADKKQLFEYLQNNKLIKRDGIYLLFDQMAVTYVGISQSIESRLKNHATKRDDWDRVIVFYSEKNNINPNICGYIEKRLYTTLRSRGFNLEQKEPDDRSLNTDDAIVTKEVMDDIDTILQLLDMAYPNATGAKVQVSSSETEDEAIMLGESIEVEFITKEVEAHGTYSDLGLKVYSGSIGVAKPQQHLEQNKTYKRILEELNDKNVIELENGKMRFMAPYVFSSSSTAAMVLSGSNRPGPLVWKRVSDKKALKEIAVKS